MIYDYLEWWRKVRHKDVKKVRDYREEDFAYCAANQKQEKNKNPVPFCLHKITVPITRQEPCQNFKAIERMNRNQIKNSQQKIDKNNGWEQLVQVNNC